MYNDRPMCNKINPLVIIKFAEDALGKSNSEHALLPHVKSTSLSQINRLLRCSCFYRVGPGNSRLGGQDRKSIFTGLKYPRET